MRRPMDAEAAPGVHDFLANGGEMGARVRAFDWAATPLGPPEAWPQTLRTAVRLLLNSWHPMFIWWGPDLIQFYNDAYSRTMGPERHPSALGQPGRECWGEIWGIIGPQIEFVMAGRGATWHEGQLVPVTRHGRREDVWWTYGYSPIDAETRRGGVGGVLVVCNDVTAEHLAREALRASEARQALLLRLVQGQRGTGDPEAMMATAAKAVGRHLRADRTGFFEMADDDTLAFGPSWTVGDTLAPLAGTFPAAGIGARYLAEVRAGRTLGIADTAADPLTAGSRFGEIGARAIIGAPIVRGGRWHAGLYVNHASPRAWTAAEAALVRDVADQTWDAVERARAVAGRCQVEG